MKKLSLIFALSILLMSSCEKNSSIISTLPNSPANPSTEVTPSVSNPSSTEEKKPSLQITLPTDTTFSRFDKFKTNGLEVKDENGNVITDYTLTFDIDGSPLTIDDYLIKEAGEYQININKEGYKTESFTINILTSTSFSQRLLMVYSPEKAIYHLNSPEKIDLTGLTLYLKTSYRNKDNRVRRYDTQLSDKDIRIEVNGVDVTEKEYTFTKEGLYTVTLSYIGNGWNNNVIAPVEYNIYVKNGSKSPVEHIDTTIQNTVSETDTYTVSIEKTNNVHSETETLSDSEDKGYYSPEEVDASFNMQSYGRNNYINWIYTPSVGKVPFLVVPVILGGDDSKATPENLSLINKAFFGNSSDLYYESLHSYYYRSSYGQLDITGTVTDFFDLKKYDPRYSSESDITELATIDIANDITNWAQNDLGYDLTEYDSDHDGLIDGLWMIYLSNSSPNNPALWAFSYTTGATGNVLSPVVNNYGWAGINFLNDTYTSLSGNFANKACDAHVLIHETGHMLGAQDYYSYSYSGYDPTGRSLMMSYNSNDHDLYTKMMFGWVTPYVVYDTSKITLIASQAKKNQLIVIPYDNKKFRKNKDGKVIFNMFDEYLVLEYYTDDDLNSKDYDCYDVYHIKGKGIRMLHIDSRLALSNRVISSGQDDDREIELTMPEDPDEVLTTTSPLVQFISNTESGERAESEVYGFPKTYDAFDELRVISADKIKLSQNSIAGSRTLFKSGNVFTIEDYQNSFPSKNKFDNGESFSYKILF